LPRVHEKNSGIIHSSAKISSRGWCKLAKT
jgi:hypothetical protein